MSDDPTTPIDPDYVPQPARGDLFDLGFRSAAKSQMGWEPPSVEELQKSLTAYEVMAFVARGGMGAVYKGVQKTLKRTVAIKVLPPENGRDDLHFAERFKREAQSMAQLSHPGIVAVHDAGETASGLLYFVMEFIEGSDVSQLIAQQGRLDPARALQITAEVLDALAFAHESGIIHRDIKPSNIMLDARGRVKVADFGLAKTTGTDTTMLTMSNITMGTPDFMAPEAMKGTASVDHRADLYAVGVMLYQMLTGELPRGRFTPPSRAVKGLDKRLDAIVDKALQTAPETRWSTAIELRTAIEPITRAIAKRTVAIARAAGPRKKPPLLAIAIAVAVLAVVAALVHFAPWKKIGANEGPHPVVTLPEKAGAPKFAGVSEVSKSPSLPVSPSPASQVSATLPFPPGQWTKVWQNPADIPNVGEVSNGWAMLKPSSMSVGLPEASGRNWGVRARFRRAADGAGPPQLQLRNHAGMGYNIILASDALIFRRSEATASGGNVELKKFPMTMPEAGHEFILGFVAIGQTLIGRLDDKTVSMQLDAADNPQLKGGFRLFQVDKNAFRDVEVLNLDGLPEAEALQAAGVSSSSISSTSQVSPTSAATFGGHRYLVVKEQIPWIEAKAKAEAMGGHLATIASKEEEDFVHNLCAKALPRLPGQAWLGGIRSVQKGPWTWITGEPFTFNGWEHGQPNWDQAAWLTAVPIGEHDYSWREITTDYATWKEHIGGYVVEWDDDGKTGAVK